MNTNNTKNSLLTNTVYPLVMITGGAAGGFGKLILGELAYSQVNVAEFKPAPTHYVYLGAIAGIVGGTVMVNRLPQIVPYQLLAIAIACGVGFPTVLNGLGNVVALNLKVSSLSQQNSQLQYDQIQSLTQIAIAPPSQQKEIAVTEAAKIAKTTTDRHLKESAIATVTEVSNVANPEIRLKAILKLKAIALESTDEDIEQILLELDSYINPQFPTVSQAAEEAIAAIEQNKANK